MIEALESLPLLGGTDRAPADRPYIAGGLRGERILVPLLNSTVPALTDQIGVATTLARTSAASLQLVIPAPTPEQTPVEHRREIDREAERELLNWAIDESDAIEHRVRGTVLHTRRVVNGIQRLIEAHDVDTLVLPRHPGDGLLRRDVTERIEARAACDVIVVNGRPGYDRVPSILLPIAGGPHSGLAADTAGRIAAHHDAWIDVLHVVEEGAPDRRYEEAEAYVEAAYHRIARPETTTMRVLEAGDAAEAIIEQSGYYTLTVIGAPTAGRLRRFVRGSTNRSIRADARSVILSARNHGGSGRLIDW